MGGRKDDGEEWDSPEIWGVHHPGVHMYLQDNAKLPTFNLPVNRSAVRPRKDSIASSSEDHGSGGHGDEKHNLQDSLIDNRHADYSSSCTDNHTGATAAKRQSAALFTKLQPPAIPKMVDAVTSGNSSKMTELFLSSDRHHRHRGFDPSFTEHQRSSSSTSSTTRTALHQAASFLPPMARQEPAISDPLDALLETDLAGLDPTPLSEIRRRHETYQAQHILEPHEEQSGESHLGAPAAAAPLASTSLSSRKKSPASPKTPPQQQQQNPDSSQSFRIGGAYPVRPVPLPIPTKKVSPPGSPFRTHGNGGENGVVASETGNNHRSPVGSPKTSRTMDNNGISTSFSASSPSVGCLAVTSTDNKPLRSSSSTKTAPSMITARMAGAKRTFTSYNTPAPAIYRASAQKAQYGFGLKHVVPAVPPPVAPGARKAKRNGATAMTAAASATTRSAMEQPALATSTGTTVPWVLVPSDSSSKQATSTAAAVAAVAAAGDNQEGDNHQGAAYERKKQRAKDARVKLNESIERLSVAIGLAGTQSRERAEHWNALPSSILGLGGRQAGIDICQECVDTCETAKKWDRPSFVGSAASLIHALNAQCEALMRELAAVHQQHESDLGRALQQHQQEDEDEPKQQQEEREDMGQAAEETPRMSSHAENSGGLEEPHCRQHQLESEIPPCDAGLQAKSSLKRKELSLIGLTKRPKLDDENNAGRNPSNTSPQTSVQQNGFPINNIEIVKDKTTENQVEYSDENKDHQKSIFSEKNIMSLVASFLDPVSLLRCQRVSRGFKSLGVFTSEQTWQDLSIARFGHFNVRQWHAKLDDEDEGVTASSTMLYRSMDRANVMPPFVHDGMFLLGEAQIPNKVSAWAFLVERSNGETLRSVRRRPDMPGRGEYMTLPIVELRTVVQNIGCPSQSLHHHHNDERIAIRDQTFSVDASTRRRGEEMKEVDWDDRFQKRLENLDGTPFVPSYSTSSSSSFLSASNPHGPNHNQLGLFESVVIVSFIYARGCSTNSKFVQRSNFSKVLIGLNTGVTMPLVIPFPRDASHLQH